MFGKTICALRKAHGMTQEALANELGVTNQAVSKWEADLCCPDMALLPKLADLFGVTLDELFGRERPAAAELPWEEDGVLRAVLYVGRRLVDGHPAAKEITFQYEGPALNVESAFSVQCDDVQGNVTAGGSVTCDDVDGDVRAEGDVTCDCVDGDVRAGGNVTCDEVAGDVCASGKVHCDHLEGNIIVNGKPLA